MQDLDICQFELVYKPQSPAGPADTVLQGFFLEITNLEDKQLQFALTFTTSPVADPDRQLLGNAAVFVDTPSINNNIGVFQITGVAGGSVFGLNRRIVVPAKGTALVAMLPSDPFPPGSVAPADANFECRGYVTISLPPIFGSGPGPIQFFPQSQGTGHQKVLLTAQNRALFTNPNNGQPNGQTQSSVPLASGQALNEITPKPPFLPPITIEPRVSDLFLPEGRDFTDVLASFMVAAEHSKMDMKAFNSALSKAGAKIQLAKAK